ncbi:glutathione S-transferase U7 [Citrus sinensis]|uniref:glutathione S-transferase U7-like n=1 Tax=Citrus sinensis TaxID=2711 RepID=UPI0003D78EDC|nr:glutathione S-transferase U7-like [Citrus sinensis]KAH9661659.1 glutathione S-transferase U7 [Citrus sinensis]
MAEEEVKLYGTWVSPFSRRIELALKLKGVPFEYIGVDLSNKSPELLKYNPIHKKIPVLVHNGKSIVESLIILEYIDDTWKNNPILPRDPHQRAVARFWAKFIDEKLLATGMKASLAEGKEKELLNEEILEQMKLLENELNGKDFFGGEAIGLVDIVATVVAFWFPVSHEVLGVEVITQEKFPVLLKWIGKLQEIDVVSQSRPPREKHVAHVRARMEGLNSGSK